MKWYTQYLEEMESDLDNGAHAKKGKRKPKRDRSDVLTELAEETTDAIDVFSPSFASMSSSDNHLSKHEREWILNYLGVFYQEHVITDVLRRVKGGKEATVYVCQAGPALGVDLIAGKLYRPRMFRNLRNDSLYREGREILDEQGKALRSGREKRAMAKKTRFGQDLRQMSWLGNEYEIMRKLHEAGADIPRPYANSENVILMEYIGDEGAAAPTLNHVQLSRQEARRIFDRLIHNVEVMLASDYVHGDLSAYNVLYWDGEIKIIDFPQTVNIYVNPHAYDLLVRDVERLCQHFARYGITADPQRLTHEIWARCIPT